MKSRKLEDQVKVPSPKSQSNDFFKKIIDHFVEFECSYEKRVRAIIVFLLFHSAYIDGCLEVLTNKFPAV